MFRTKVFLAIFTAVVFLPSARMFSLDDWIPVTPEDLKMTVDPAHPADAIILYHEEVSDDMTRHRRIYKRVKVLTEKGKGQANVEIPYDAGRIGVTDIRARTIAPDGTITPFSGKALDQTIVKAHGLKYLAKTFTMPNVQVGSIIEWRYTEFWDDLLIEPHWVVQDELFQKRAKFTFVPFFKAGYTVRGGHDEILDRVYYSFIGLPTDTAIKNTANNGMELELKDIPAFVTEDYSLPPAVLKMRVNFYYGTDKMAKPQEFWKNEGKYWSRDIEKFTSSTPAIVAAVNQTISPSDTAEQKAKKIYAFVQKIKNLNFASREGRLDELITRESKAKRTLDDVLRTNEGYRDELARLFLAMARVANVPAFLMRIADRDEILFQPNIPNPSQLTSEIAIVRSADGKEVFLDPGTPLCPYGLLAWQHNSTQGIRQTSGGGTEMAQTSPASYKDAISKRVARLALAEDGSAKGKVAIAWAGIGAVLRRLDGLRTDDAGRKKDLEEEMKGLLPQGALVSLDSTSGWDNADDQLKATFSVEIPSLATTAGKRMLVPTNLFEAQRQQPFTSGDRKNAIYFNYPYYTMDDTQITFPASMHAENVAQTQPVRTEYSLYKIQRNVNGNTIAVNRDFAIAEIAFPAKDYPDLRKFYAGVLQGDSEQLVLTSAK